LHLFYQVKEAYFEYYYITRRNAILKENVQLLEQMEGVIQAKYRTGTASYANLVKIQVELDKLQNRLKSVIDASEPIKARLNAALNRPLHATLPIPKEIPGESESLDLSRDRLVSLLKKNNPGLMSMDSMAAREQINIKLAKKNYYPDFSIGLDYMVTGESLMPGIVDSGKDPIAAMVSIRLPLWFSKNKAAVKEANARYRAVLNEKKEVENNLLVRLEMVFFKYRDAGRKMALYRKTLIPRANQALEVTRSAFEAGKADFLDFIDSQRTLLAFELEYEEARTRRAQRLAELQMIAASPTITEGGSFRENPTAWGNICRATTAEYLSSDVSPPWAFLTPHRQVSPNPPAKAFDKALIKSFLGVQGAIFQKSPLAAGGTRRITDE
jgi:outer membrane protein TolC